MITINDYAGASKQVASNPVQILKVEGRMSDAAAASGLYLQIWDVFSSGDVATLGILKKVYPLVGGAGTGAGQVFLKNFNPGDDELECSMGCFITVSSTEATLTQSASVYASLLVELRIPEQPAVNSTIGDLTSAVTGLQVWTEASGTTTKKRLLLLEVDGTNLTGTTQWIMLFAKNTVNTGDSPAQGDIIPITCGATLGVLTGTKAKRFGWYGREMVVNDAGTYRYGCNIKISSTTPNYTAANGTACIRARYLTAP